MKKVMFLCHGNICRSPIAEFVFKDMAKDYDVHIESKAVSREEIGNGIYPKAADVLRRNGIAFGGHSARQITRGDYDEFDYIIVMEQYNLPRLMSIIGSDDQGKVSRLLDFTPAPDDIEDPWYSGNFDKVYAQIRSGCGALLEHMKQNGEI
ncbi:MAG: low molecular weight phosphotyrosine protein phosphatase [Clostridia bacterium]|nr:low molecular weight phosphotyrosine protein phosphatase [Clostridia bacterium]